MTRAPELLLILSVALSCSGVPADFSDDPLPNGGSAEAASAPATMSVDEVEGDFPRGGEGGTEAEADGGAESIPKGETPNGEVVIAAVGGAASDADGGTGTIEPTPSAGGAGGEGSAIDDSTIAAAPSCSGLADDDYCGGDLTWPGEVNSIYMCAAGFATFVVECPGSCENGKCPGSPGISDGSNDDGTDPTPSCLTCAEERCPEQSLACHDDAMCSDYRICASACGNSAACVDQCEQAFGPNVAYDQWFQCARIKCAKCKGELGGG